MLRIGLPESTQYATNDSEPSVKDEEFPMFQVDGHQSPIDHQSTNVKSDKDEEGFGAITDLPDLGRRARSTRNRDYNVDSVDVRNNDTVYPTNRILSFLPPWIDVAADPRLDLARMPPSAYGIWRNSPNVTYNIGSSWIIFRYLVLPRREDAQSCGRI